MLNNKPADSVRPPSTEDWIAAIAWVQHIDQVFAVSGNQIARKLKTLPLLESIKAGRRDTKLWDEIVLYAEFIKTNQYVSKTT